MGVDPRPVLRAAYAAFQEGSKPERILAAADPMKGSRDTFYANLVRHCWWYLVWCDICFVAGMDMRCCCNMIIPHTDHSCMSAGAVRGPVPRVNG